MNFHAELSLCRSLIILLFIGVFTAVSHAQITLSGATPSGTPIPGPATETAPSNQFKVVATVSPTPTKVVFYRNDVEYKTVTSAPWEIIEDELGQETYTYRARAYDISGDWVESNEYKMTVHTGLVFTMGDEIPTPAPTGTPYPSPTPTPYQTKAADRYEDHTADIEAAIAYLSSEGGGTLFFPCNVPDGQGVSIYNIRSTIDIPSNITLQGESAELSGPCRIYWYDAEYEYPSECGDLPEDLVGKPMFRIQGGSTRIRIRDMSLWSGITGTNCGGPGDGDWEVIKDFENTAIELNTDMDCEGKGCPSEPAGDITDVIFENLTIQHFTYGIRAYSDNESDISGIKIRDYTPANNHRQLYIDASHAGGWDIQNINIRSMLPHQGAVEIIEAGTPSSHTADEGKLKFLQLNCNGSKAQPKPFCVSVEKHGGLYFRQLHHEGPDQAIIVEEIAEDNDEPIVLESSVGTGIFKDDSMKLYLIGNGVFAAPEVADTRLDEGRLRFEGEGTESTVVDCGDVHWDLTDFPETPTDDPLTHIFQMQFSHTERNRGSFFARNGSNETYIKPHIPCPVGKQDVSDINDVGGVSFDSGVLPNEPAAHSFTITTANCNLVSELGTIFADTSNYGSVFIAQDCYVNNTITIPRGRKIVGVARTALVSGTELALTVPNKPLFRIDVKVTALNDRRESAINLRDLELITDQTGTTGIEMLGGASASVSGVSSDFHFSNLLITGFEKGIFAAPQPTKLDPMIDGVSMKHLKFVDNTVAAVDIYSGNASNWNVIDLSMSSSTSGAVGWKQLYAGFIGQQGVRCNGVPAFKMARCLDLQMVQGFYLNGLRQPQSVTNAMTIEWGGTMYSSEYQGVRPSVMTIRNSNFTAVLGSTNNVDIIGRSFITSMNNRYTNITASGGNTYQGELSRVTHCGDSYSGTPYGVLQATYDDKWVGFPAPTRIECGTPVPWEDAVRWTYDLNDNDVGQPMVGNFFDDVQEDFVTFKPGSSARFLIQETDGPGRFDIPFGTTGDIPIIGRFAAGDRSHIGVYRPSTGVWWIHDPIDGPMDSSDDANWSFGISTDKPIVGNFILDCTAPCDDPDEIAVYRSSGNAFWIMNPRTSAVVVRTPSHSSGSEIQVGDFLGLGYDQIAQYDVSNGEWDITDPVTAAQYTADPVLSPVSGDVLVSGRYLPPLPGKDPCIQLGIWRPGDEKFYIADVDVNNISVDCGTRSADMLWGKDFGSSLDNDIPLKINTPDGTLDRPVAYRISEGVYTRSIAQGQWWVHKPF